MQYHTIGNAALGLLGVIIVPLMCAALLFACGVLVRGLYDMARVAVRTLRGLAPPPSWITNTRPAQTAEQRRRINFQGYLVIFGYLGIDLWGLWHAKTTWQWTFMLLENGFIVLGLLYMCAVYRKYNKF